MLSICMNAAQSEQRDSGPRWGLSLSSCTRAVSRCGRRTLQEWEISCHDFLGSIGAPIQTVLQIFFLIYNAPVVS